MTENDETEDRQDRHLADTLAQREADRRKRARRSSMESFRELNQRRAEKGLPPVWPTAPRGAPEGTIQ